MAKEHVDPVGDNEDTGSAPAGRAVPSPYTRSFSLEDISIRAGGDGRTVDAYAAVFNVPAGVHDQDGDYEEIIDPSAFNRAIDHSQRSGRRFPVLYNHGQTLWGTPSELDSMPIGTTEEIRADQRGLFTRSRYHTSDRADAALEAIREGSISAYSFSGAFHRSSPVVPRGGFRRGRDGVLPVIHRLESTLREYGPTPFPVYTGAQVVGVRAEQVALLLGQLPPGEFERLATLFRSGTLTDPPDLGTPLDGGPAADGPPAGHPTRSPREELQARRAQFIIRQGARKP